MNKCPYSFVDSDGKVFEPESHPLRPGMPEIPLEMQHLPVDERRKEVK